MKLCYIKTLTVLLFIGCLLNADSQDRVHKTYLYGTCLNKKHGPLTWPEAKLKFDRHPGVTEYKIREALRKSTPETLRDHMDNIHMPQALERAYFKIISFMESDTYEQVFRDICSELLPVFEDARNKYHGTKQPVIISDIDEVALSNLELWIETLGEGIRGGRNLSDFNYNFRLQQRCTRIEPMPLFYETLRALGYKIIFITSRRETNELKQATRENLEKEGFTVDAIDGLFMTSLRNYEAPETFDPINYKESIREMLAEKYEIIGCIGCSQAFITGKYTGEIAVQLPNWLY